MDPNIKDQIINLIDKSQNILLMTHAKADCDGLGAMIAMYNVLQQLGKEVVASTNDPAPENLSFLPSINIVQNSISSKNFIITLDISQSPLKKIKYKLSDDKKRVNIIMTPSYGRYSKEDLNFTNEKGNFDLIITLDTGNLEHLGPIYEQNSELFFKIPIINIDHHSSNTDFGKINLVDLVASSTTEIVLSILEAMEKRYDKSFINEDIATLLLAGIITDTGSFQHANTSPSAMETAAKLLDMGARQQEIIKNIYKTKKLSTLKLWGTVLSKVQTDPIYRIVWSSINKNDLLEAGASSEESENIIDELLSNAPGTEVIILFKYNDEGYVSASMRSTTNGVDVGEICSEMGGGGHMKAAGFKRRNSNDLEKLIEDTLKKIRQYQAKRLNIHIEDIPEINESSKEIEITPDWEEETVENPVENEEKEKSEKKVQYLNFSGEFEKKTENKTVKNKERKEFKQNNFNKNKKTNPQANRQKRRMIKPRGKNENTSNNKKTLKTNNITRRRNENFRKIRKNNEKVENAFNDLAKSNEVSEINNKVNNTVVNETKQIDNIPEAIQSPSENENNTLEQNETRNKIESNEETTNPSFENNEEVNEKEEMDDSIPEATDEVVESENNATANNIEATNPSSETKEEIKTEDNSTKENSESKQENSEKNQEQI